jgi:carbonic anhydrase
MTQLHEASCACCSGLTAIFNRRQFVRAVAVGSATLGFTPYFALTAEGNYEAMILSCIDPRMQEPVRKYTVEQNLTGKFSQFVIAGAAIGVVAPAFKEWHKAFWDNLATSSCTTSRR